MQSQRDSVQRFQFPHSSTTVSRMGYDAMRLAGLNAWGTPNNPDKAVALLREAVACGVDRIDTADMYGPHIVNQIIKKHFIPIQTD